MDDLPGEKVIYPAKKAKTECGAENTLRAAFAYLLVSGMQVSYWLS